MPLNMEIYHEIEKDGVMAVLHRGIQQYVGGCIDVSLMNFGVFPLTDPRLSIKYGNECIETALECIERKMNQIGMNP